MRRPVLPAVVALFCAAVVSLFWLSPAGLAQTPSQQQSQSQSKEQTPPPQQRGPATADERARVVKTAQELQSDPLSRDSRPDREWFVKWIVEVPDVSVPFCATLLGDMGDKDTGYPGALVAAEVASEAALVIQHPDKAHDEPAQYLAGVEGALMAYQRIRGASPKYRVKELDELARKREQGKLPQAVAEAATKCKK